MPYEIVIGDISDLKFKVDVIVTLACPDPHKIGYGVDRAIFDKAGEKMREDRLLRKPHENGKMFIASAHKLNAQRLIHAYSPYYINGEQGEDGKLRECYDNAMSMAYTLGYRSIAFPLISSGNNGFPIRVAYRVAMCAFHEFCEKHIDMHMYLIIFDEQTIGYCRMQRMNIRTDDQVQMELSGGKIEWEYPEKFRERDAWEYPKTRQETYESIKATNALKIEEAVAIDDIFRKTAGKDIFTVLCELMEYATNRRKCKPTSICRSAYLGDEYYSNNVKNQKGSTMSKQKVLGFAIAFRLNLQKTEELLHRAGYALQPDNQFDAIVMEHIACDNYDIDAINQELVLNGQIPFGPAGRNFYGRKGGSHKPYEDVQKKTLYNGDHKERLPGEKRARHNVSK